MRNGGGNNYELPHMKKEVLKRLGTLPRRLSCSKSLYLEVEELVETKQAKLDEERERTDLIWEEFSNWEAEVLRLSQVPWLEVQNREEDVILEGEVDGPPVEEEEWD
jgi:hypothetical protein